MGTYLLLFHSQLLWLAFLYSLLMRSPDSNRYIPAHYYNPVLQAALYEVVDNQIKELNPPQTKQTYERLVAEGNSPQEAKRLIGCVVVSEIFDVLKKSQPYNEARYVAALNRLPKMPWDK